MCTCVCAWEWEWAWHIRKLKRQRHRRRATCKQIYQLRDAAAHQEMATISLVPPPPCCHSPHPLIVTLLPPLWTARRRCCCCCCCMYNPNPESNLNARFISHLNHAWKSLLLSTAKGSIPLQMGRGRGSMKGDALHTAFILSWHIQIFCLLITTKVFWHFTQKKTKADKDEKAEKKATFGMSEVLYPCTCLYPTIVAMLVLYNIAEFNYIIYVHYYVLL